MEKEKKNREGRGRKKFWSRKMYFVEEKKDGEGKEGKYLEKEIRGEKKNREGKGEKYLEKESVTMAGQTTTTNKEK